MEGIFYLEGRKYMQKDSGGGLRGLQEVLQDYTTLYAHSMMSRQGQPTPNWASPT